MKELNRIAASKRLSRFRLKIDDDLMKANIIWCRTAYGNVEDIRTNANRHSFYELHYVLDGEMRTVVDDSRAINIKDSQFIIIPPNRFHYTENVQVDTEKFVCGFTIESDNEFIRDTLAKLADIRLYRESEIMRSYIDLMLLNADEQKAGASVTITRLLECLLLEFFRQISPEERETGCDRKIFENDRRVDEIKSYIERNIMLNITGSDVAGHLNISLRHLNRLTNMYLGCPVNKLIANYRADHIKNLLTNAEYTLSDIAEMTGFSSEYAMSRFFKQNEGMSVGLYRRSVEK